MWRNVFALGFILWLALCLLVELPYCVIDFDSGIHALIAKSIAFGNGWNTTYGEYADNSSGDVILWPTAAMIWLLGNQRWVPALSAILINLSILVCVLSYSKRILSSATWLALTSGLLFWFSYFEASWWHVLTGDLASYFVLLLACFVTIDERLVSEKQRFILLGISMVLSFYCKLVTAPGFAGIAIYLFWFHRNNIKLLATHAGFALMAAGLTFTFIKLAEYYQLQFNPHPHSYLELLEWRWNATRVIFHSQSALQGSPEGLFQFSPPSVKVYGDLLAKYGYPAAFAYALLAFPVLAVGLAVFNLRHKKFHATDKLVLLLCLCYGFYFVQYFKIYHSPYDHHAFQTIYTLFIIILLVCIRYAKMYGALAFIFFQLLIANLAHSAIPAAYLDRLLLQPDKNPVLVSNQRYLQGTRDVTHFIETTSFDAPLANCGFLNGTREVDYALPHLINFNNCFDLISQNFVWNKALNHYEWNHPVSFTLVINKFYWKAAKVHKPTLLRQNMLIEACQNHLLYESTYYKILSCSFEDLKHTLPDDDTNPFMPRPPEWADLH